MTHSPALTLARAHIVWLAFGECRSPGWDGPPPSALEAVAAIDSELAASADAGRQAQELMKLVDEFGTRRVMYGCAEEGSEQAHEDLRDGDELRGKIVAALAALSRPAPATMANGLTEAETSATASVAGLIGVGTDKPRDTNPTRASPSIVRDAMASYPAPVSAQGDEQFRPYAPGVMVNKAAKVSQDAAGRTTISMPGAQGDEVDARAGASQGGTVAEDEAFQAWALKTDAMRYRWLRDECREWEDLTSAWLYEGLDTAVDAARAQQGGPEVTENYQTPVIVSYRDNASGEVVQREEDCNLNDEGGPSPFWYSEGNANCDCNRRTFFWSIKGIDIHADEPEDGWPYGEYPAPCGHEAFSVNLATPDGKVFYREFEEATPAQQGGQR